MYIEIEVAREYGRTIDEWMEKPEEVRFIHEAHFRLRRMKEAFAYTDEKDKFTFFVPKDD